MSVSLRRSVWRAADAAAASATSFMRAFYRVAAICIERSRSSAMRAASVPG
ncbi:hypothetical protein [Thermomonas brevis]